MVIGDEITYKISLFVFYNTFFFLFSEKNLALIGEEMYNQWAKKRRSSFYNNMGSFCCICRPNYL